jgi:hypothetical protein
MITYSLIGKCRTNIQLILCVFKTNQTTKLVANIMQKKLFLMMKLNRFLKLKLYF